VALLESDAPATTFWQRNQVDLPTPPRTGDLINQITMRYCGHSPFAAQLRASSSCCRDQVAVLPFSAPPQWLPCAGPVSLDAQIGALADEGKALVVISSCLPEVLSISDRILVARLGRIVAEFDAAAATEERIMYAAIH
jgi:hypothetical protein